MDEISFKKQIHKIKSVSDFSIVVFMVCVLGFCGIAFLKMDKIAFAGLENDWFLIPWVAAVIAWSIGWHFQTKSKALRCPKCNGLFLAKGRGSGVVFADKCHSCGWDLNSVKEV